MLMKTPSVSNVLISFVSRSRKRTPVTESSPRTSSTTQFHRNRIFGSSSARFRRIAEPRIAFGSPSGCRTTIEIDSAKRYLINPGSVGQPRDRDPRAAYLIYDTTEGRIIWRRQEYALEKAQRRILDAGLPEVLAYRLAAGL